MRRYLFIVTVAYFAGLPTVAAVDNEVNLAPGSVNATYGKLPMRFEANHGQAEPDFKYLVRGLDYVVLFSPRGVVFASQPISRALANRQIESQPVISPSIAVHISFDGAHFNPAVLGLEPLKGHVNYFLGRDPAHWRTAIPTFRSIRYSNIYRGIDLDFYGNQNQLEYDFLLAPHADPTKITMNVSGSESLAVDKDGALVLTTQGRTLKMRKPAVYQDVGSKRRAVDARFVLKSATQAGFALASYDTSKPLTIDPVLEYATFLGGTGVDEGNAIAVDRVGQAYITGTTTSLDFPAVGAWRSLSAGADDVFVTKLNANGTDYVYSTYLGGGWYDKGYGIAADSAGNAYVTGSTSSSDFPLSNPFQGSLASRSTDVFVTKLNPTGTRLVYSTYLGGSGTEVGRGIAVDAIGGAYLTGETGSVNKTQPYPTKNPIPGISGSFVDVFVTKISPAGNSLIYSTLVGGTGKDAARGIAVDTAGSAYICGTSSSDSFPTKNALQARRGGVSDAFVLKLTPLGSSIVYSTYLGGDNQDEATGIAVDQSGSAYITGWSNSSNYPVFKPIYTHRPGWVDSFVTKLSPTGTALVYSTYFSTTNAGSAIMAYAIAVNLKGSALITGHVGNGGLRLISPVQPVAVGSDAFIAKFNPAGTAPDYSTYFGGGDGRGIATDLSGRVYVTGANTNPRTFPATGVIQPIHAAINGKDAFVARLNQ